MTRMSDTFRTRHSCMIELSVQHRTRVCSLPISNATLSVIIVLFASW